jgi:hypothetical protein
MPGLDATLDPPIVFVAGVVAAALLWLWGQLTRIAAGVCDQPSCPTAAEIHNSR